MTTHPNPKSSILGQISGVCLALALAGCATAPPCVPKVEIVKQPVYITLRPEIPAIAPADLLLEDPAVVLQLATTGTLQEIWAVVIHDFGELVRVNHQQRAILDALGAKDHQ